MRIRDTIDYAATPERVFAMLSDRGLPGAQGRGHRRALALGLDHDARRPTPSSSASAPCPPTSCPTSSRASWARSCTSPRPATWGPAAADGSRRGRLDRHGRRRADHARRARLSLAPPGPGQPRARRGRAQGQGAAARRQDRAGRRARHRGGDQRRAQYRRRLARRLTPTRPRTNGRYGDCSPYRPSLSGRRPTFRADSLARSAPRCARCSRAGRQPITFGPTPWHAPLLAALDAHAPVVSPCAGRRGSSAARTSP